MAEQTRSTGRTAARATRLAHQGRDVRIYGGKTVNPPVSRASTILFDDLASLRAGATGHSKPDFVQYGRFGTETHIALRRAWSDLEGSDDTLLLPCGLAANVLALLAFVESGDHLLMIDNVYAPTRGVCDGLLRPLGVETTYFDPQIGAAIEELIRPNSKLIYLETPGSHSFDLCDVPAYVEVARRHGLKTALDNTWATPLFYRPLEQGIDVSIQAGTKYLGGHSDVMLGLVAANGETVQQLRSKSDLLGYSVAADDAYLALRGFRTLEVRLRRHEASALQVARWLRERPEVERVLHPALPDHPRHDLFARDFDGASGLFGLVLKPGFPAAAIEAMVDGFTYFGLGYSWGGYESLIVPSPIEKMRTATGWEAVDRTLRIHIGLEDPSDLIDDLASGFKRLSATAQAAE
ncbi:cystathionine beta-lyase [Algihabitans albus]|uniref:cystathionine beta-lyase n=1 Tax=Algihabitans albus TaxID=2164067 RepID=UPI000E5CF485|nr:cystathionine beta-lyase [Algihabitans albus]